MARRRRRRCRRRLRIARGSIRNRRRCGHRTGAVPGFRRRRRSRPGAHAALHRHLPRGHRPDRPSVISHPFAARLRIARCCAGVGGAVRDRCRGRGGHCGVRPGRRVQVGVCADCRGDRGAALARRRALGRGRRVAWPGSDDRLRVSDRPRLVADGDQRRVANDDDPHALQQADPQQRRHRCRHRRPGVDRRHNRLRAGWTAASRNCRRSHSASCR